MNTILQIAIAAAVVAMFAFLIATGVSRTERAECFKWQAEAKEYPGYYLTQWQSQQCLANGIEIDAPVL